MCFQSFALEFPDKIDASASQPCHKPAMLQQLLVRLFQSVTESIILASDGLMR